MRAALRIFVRSFALWAFVTAFLLRLVHAFGIPLPSNDGAQYLWISERFALGEFSEGLNSVFHPGSSLLHALFMQLGLGSFAAARLDGALLGAIWVVLLLALCRRMSDPVAARAITILAIVSFPGVRLVAEVYSEPLYMVWIASAFLFLLQGRLRLAAFFVGSAFWIRPEALTLLPLLLWPGWRWPRRAQAFAIALVCALAFVLLRRWLLGDLSLTPKLALMAPLGPLGATSFGDFVLRFADNLAHLPLAGMASLDHVGVLLGIVGLVLLSRFEHMRARLLWAALALGWLAMALFQVKPRFFLSQAPLLLPLAAFAFARLRFLAQDHARAQLGLQVCVALLFVSILAATVRVGADLLDPPRRDRVAELVLGRALGTRLAPADRLVTDMPRVAWAAGRQPPPPTIWTAARLTAAIESRQPRILVLGKKRRALSELLPLLGQHYRELPLPEPVRASPGADRLALYERR